MTLTRLVARLSVMGGGWGGAVWKLYRACIQCKQKPTRQSNTKKEILRIKKGLQSSTCSRGKPQAYSERSGKSLQGRDVRTIEFFLQDFPTNIGYGISSHRSSQSLSRLQAPEILTHGIHERPQQMGSPYKDYSDGYPFLWETFKGRGNISSGFVSCCIYFNLNSGTQF